MQPIKWIISAVAVGLIAARLLWPQIQVDAITLGLLIVAVLPWASTLIESAKLPGGWEVKFRDLKAASAAIEASPSPAAQTGDARKAEQELQEAVRPIYETNANLALVALRIDIEKRLRLLAHNNNVSSTLPLTQLLRELTRQEVLPPSIGESLNAIIDAGNRAAHGASVEPSVQSWAIDSGSKVLRTLDDLMKPEVTIE